MSIPSIDKRHTYLYGIFFIVFLFGALTFVLFGEFIPDDTFIHIGYANDICEGKGYSFAGNRTYGSTSPLWPVSIAILGLLHINLEFAARLLSFLFSVSSIILMYYIARLRFRALISFGSSCLLCFNAYFLRWSLTGMEATASCFFMLILIGFLFYENRGTVNSISYLIIGLSPLIRPEFYLFVSIFFLYVYFFQPNKYSVKKLFFASLPILIWNCFAFLYYKTFIPTTFSAKAGDAFFSIEYATIMRSAMLFFSGNPIELCIIIFASICLIIKYRKSKWTVARKVVRSENMLIMVLIVLFYLFYISKNVTIISRYSLILLPLVILFMIALLVKVCEQFKISQRVSDIILIIVITISLAVHCVFTFYIIKPDSDSFAHGFQREYKNIASMLSNSNCTDCSVAVSEVGIIGVYSGMKVYDLVGLVDKDRFNFSSHKDYIVAKKPSYLVSRGEVSLNEFKDTPISFQEIYSVSIAGFGINSKEKVQVRVYKVK
jgi:hypothetical protein